MPHAARFQPNQFGPSAKEQPTGVTSSASSRSPCIERRAERWLTSQHSETFSTPFLSSGRATGSADVVKLIHCPDAAWEFYLFLFLAEERDSIRHRPNSQAFLRRSSSTIRLQSPWR